LWAGASDAVAAYLCVLPAWPFRDVTGHCTPAQFTAAQITGRRRRRRRCCCCCCWHCRWWFFAVVRERAAADSQLCQNTMNGVRAECPRRPQQFKPRPPPPRPLLFVQPSRRRARPLYGVSKAERLYALMIVQLLSLLSVS